MDEKTINNNPNQNQGQNNQDNSPLAKNIEPSENEEKKRIELHTLKDDLEKFKQSGGEVDFSNSINENSPASNPQEEKEPVFSPPPFSPDNVQEVGTNSQSSLDQQPTNNQPPRLPKKTNSTMLIIEIVGGALAIALLVASGAYLVYFRKPNKNNKVALSPSPIPNQTKTLTPKPTNIPQTTPSSPISSTPLSTTTPTTTPIVQDFHQSLFSNINSSSNINVSLLSPVILKNKLEQQANTNLPVGSIKEVVILKNNQFVPFADFFEAMIPEISNVSSKENTKLTDVFENNFSLGIFYLNNGPQLVYVGKIKSGQVEKAKALIKDLISIPNLAQNLAKTHFFVDPGQPVFGSFKQGKLGDVSTYYIVYTNNHLSFDFGFKDNYFLVFTSKESYDKLISVLK